MARLHRASGQPYPPPRGATLELSKQLKVPSRQNDPTQSRTSPRSPIRCSAGNRWQWTQKGDHLFLIPPPKSGPPQLERKSSWPAPVLLPEIGKQIVFLLEPIDSWMKKGRRNQTALSSEIATGSPVKVRFRKPGDRIQPIGCRFARRLKEVLIDAKVPREERDQIPLLLINDSIVWVPGCYHR